MKKRGRPRKDDKDLPYLVWMAHIWVSQGCKGSVRSLVMAENFDIARYCADPPPRGVSLSDIETASAQPPNLKTRTISDAQHRGIESTSKRLQQKFRQLRSNGTMLQAGAFMQLETERHRALKKMKRNDTGSFSIFEVNDNTFIEMNRIAIEALAGTLSVRRQPGAIAETQTHGAPEN